MRGRRVLVAVLLVSLAMLAGAVGLARWGLPRVSDFWPLDLAEPGGWLIDRQLADLRTDVSLCHAVMKPAVVAVRAVPDATPSPGCGWHNAVAVSRVAAAKIALNPLTCEAAAALALWIRHVVEPAAEELLGSSVVRIETLGSYACRNMRGNPKYARHPSQHASANAADISAFHLADGRRITLTADWGKATPAGAFLARIHHGACRYFRVAIGPGYNAAHRDHFHLDRGRWHACR